MQQSRFRCAKHMYFANTTIYIYIYFYVRRYTERCYTYIARGGPLCEREVGTTDDAGTFQSSAPRSPIRWYHIWWQWYHVNGYTMVNRCDIYIYITLQSCHCYIHGRSILGHPAVVCTTGDAMRNDETVREIIRFLV